MKRFQIVLGAALLLGTSQVSAWEGQVVISTPNTSLVLHANEGEDLRQDYYGGLIAGINQLKEGGSDFNFAALPTFGTIDMIHLPALQIQHSDGDLNLELRVENYELKDENNAKTHVFTMADKLLPVTVKVFYKAYKKVDIIETWTEISHREKGNIILKRFDSGSLTVRRSDVWITHLHGDWCAEAQLTQEPLTRGLKVIRNSDGARNAHCDAPEIMLSLDGEPREDEGRTIGAALCWSGNYEIRVNTNNSKTHQLYAGIDPQSSEYVLEAGRSFVTPHLALTYSDKGMGEVSRNFHRWARTEGMLHRGMNTGDILLNSWEGIYFDITEQKIIDMMDDIAQFGGELFVMDDGWFGSKYQRNDDSSTLGDWVTDLKKLPGGIKSLTDAARQRKIKFGIWIEPEAVNTKSELFEQHPEWALQTKGRELKLGRGGTQLVLDMTNPKVQDFAFKIVDDLLTQYPEISYLKWDANASIQNYGSLYLPKNKQNNLYIDYHLGLLKVLERIRQKYPDVVIQDCASGGGRANYGLLPYFDEFWVSDNTDALQRVYIQWGTSLFFPANAMAQHIGGVPYWNTGGRITPIKFRCDVAMSGRLGIELQPKHMNEEEKLQCTTCFADYKELRQTIQTGDLYRLQNPYNRKGIASLMYVNESKSQAVVFAYKVDNYYSMPIPCIRLKGLSADATYTVTEKDVKAWQNPCDLSGKRFTGQFLMEVGLEIPLDWDYASRVFELRQDR